MAPKKRERVIPTGDCWCGCGTEVPIGKFFAPGHDKTAESTVIREVYGSVPEFLAAHGYDPKGPNWGKARRARKQ